MCRTIKIKIIRELRNQSFFKSKVMKDEKGKCAAVHAVYVVYAVAFGLNLPRCMETHSVAVLQGSLLTQLLSQRS